MKMFSFVILMVILLAGFASNAFAEVSPPELTVEIDGTYLTLSWTEVANASGYRLYYAAYPYEEGDPIYSAEVFTNTSFSIDLPVGAAYYAAIKAYDASSESDYSNIELILINLDAPVLDVETSGLLVNLSWTEVPGAAGYRLYFAPYPSSDPDPFNYLDLGNATSAPYYLWENAAYTVFITAYDASGSDITDASNVEDFILGPPNPEWVDDDGDGFTEFEGDCDDEEININPDALEICGDDIDQDCNGEVELCPTVDEDDDGFTPAAGDCDDSDPNINPDAVEICGDDIDQNCSGTDLPCPIDPNEVDDDNDGFTENQGDCNDAESTINPGAPEVCGDDIDQDCSGTDLPCLIDPNDTDNVW